jgi:hypothetical protein
MEDNQRSQRGQSQNQNQNQIGNKEDRSQLSNRGMNRQGQTQNASSPQSGTGRMDKNDRNSLQENRDNR